MDSGIARRFEERGIDINGQVAIDITHKTPLFDEDGRVIGMLGISVDITERKRHESALQEKRFRAEEQKETINTYIKPFLAQGSAVISLLIYAIIVTILAVLVTFNLTRLQQRLEKERD